MKTPTIGRVKVRRHIWHDKITDAQVETIQIWQGNHFVTLRIDQARKVVDLVHDRADEHDAEQREKGAEQ